MVESFKEIGFEGAKSIDELDQVLKDKLGIGFLECGEALQKFIQENAEELVEDVANIAPNGDYGKLLEDKQEMAKFLREEASKPENWEIQMVEVKKKQDQLMELVFFNSAVDDGDIMKGFVFLGLSGKIRHAFVQLNN